MNSGLVVCPCCGQMLCISISDLNGFTASIPVFNNQELQRQIYSQMNCSIHDNMTWQWQQQQMLCAQNIQQEKI